ncbi:MAG: ABC transporter substrate-binding protein [Deltaproteobacteria bacterium]|nr:ABC transporter substrate-binding protein [Deltaproteobacteria bacterium]
MNHMSRRNFLKKAASATCLGAASYAVPGFLRHASAATQVTLALDFVILGRHAPFYLALKKGFWADRGLDVSIARGFGNVDTARRVDNKQADFGFTDLPGVALTRAQGAKLRMIAMIYQNWPHTIFAKPGIRTPKDLEGHVFGTPPGSTGTQLMPAFAEVAGVNWSKVKVVNLDIATQNAALIAGKVDAISTFRFFIPFFRSKMSDVSVLSWVDYGWKMYSNGIVAHEQTLAQKPEVVRSFVEGALLGYKHAMANPDEAVEALVSNRPEIARDAAEAEQPIIKDLVVSPEVNEHGVGYFSPAKIQFTFDMLYRYADLPKKISPKETFTEKYLSPVKL